MNKMEKSEETSVQNKIVKAASSMKYLAYAGLVLMLSLLAVLVVFSMLIYRNTQDIKMAYISDAMGTFRHDHAVRMNSRFRDLLQHQNKVDRDLTFHIVKTGEMNKENIVVIGQEEIITTPKARIIFDFSKGWMVTKMLTAGANSCYISQFNMTETIENVRDCLLKDKNMVFVIGDEIRIQYRSTEKIVNRTSLSPNAAVMCENSSLVWFVEVTGDESHGLVKRGDGRGSWLVGLPNGSARQAVYLN